MAFIEWCNGNQGFISTVLSLLTLIFSGTAIVVSLNTAKLPFLKKIKLTAGFFKGPDTEGIHVTAVNIGNRPVTICMMGLIIRNKQLIIPSQIGQCQRTIRPTEQTIQQFPLDDLVRVIAERGYCENEYIYEYAEDTEGDVYKRKIGQVRDIVNY